MLRLFFNFLSLEVRDVFFDFKLDIVLLRFWIFLVLVICVFLSLFIFWRRFCIIECNLINEVLGNLDVLCFDLLNMLDR